MENEYKGEDIRFCSAYLFGDSKFIEKHRLLADEFNKRAIIQRPNIIYVRCDVDLMINGINLKELTQKLTLAAFFGGRIETLKVSKATVVISENLSFFMSANPNNAIFLYNKGFHLTKQITAFVKRLPYEKLIFFGDADANGIAIYNSFKENFKDIEFYPDFETIEFVMENFYDKLPALNNTDNLNFNHLEDVFEYLKMKNKKIEQEFLQVLFAKGGLKKPLWIG